MASASPSSGLPKSAASGSVDKGKGRMQSIYQEHRKNFGYALGKRPSRQGSRGSKVPKVKSWSHMFFCLSDPECDYTPDFETRNKLKAAGLGPQKITFT